MEDKIFSSWEEYYNSNQEYYLDEDNGGDEDIQEYDSNIYFAGKTDIHSYYFGELGERDIIVVDVSLDEARALATIYFNGGNIYEEVDKLNELTYEAKNYLCEDFSNMKWLSMLSDCKTILDINNKLY